MFTKENLESMEKRFEYIDAGRKIYEDEAIKMVLRFFNLPETKSENIHSIDEFLEYDHIVIFMPEDNYRTIDFSKLRIPKKLSFQVNRYSEEWSICAFNEYKQPQLTISFTPGKL